MAGEKIGLTAVMEMAGFTQGINKYNEMVGGASSNTERHAGIMSKAFAGIGEAVKMASAVAVGGVAALASALTGSVFATMSWGDKLKDVSEMLGTTSEESAMLAVAAQHIGGNVEQLTGQLAFMARGLTNAKGELGTTGIALKNMGINALDANGNMRPTLEILQEAANRINAMPPGLDKTSAMMDVFGKSGKSMSDMLEVLAGTGMKDMDAKAKALGLSMSGPAVQGAINLKRSFNDLKMMGEGLLVQIGTAALPIFQNFASVLSKIGQEVIPVVVSAIKPLIDWISQGASAFGGLVNALLQGQSPLFAISDFIMRIFGMDAAIKFHEIAGGVLDFAAQARDALLPILQQVGDFIINTVVPAIGMLVDWIGKQIPIVIAIATDIFTNSLLPALQSIGTFITEQVVPTFMALVNFILEHVVPMFEAILPRAIQFLSTIFTGIIMPVLSALFAFFRDNIIPILSKVCDWMAANLPGAIDKATQWVKGTLIPALQDIWTFVKETLLPILGKIIVWLAETIKTAIEFFVTDIWPKLKTAFGVVKDFIVNDLYPRLKDIADWLGPIIKTIIETFVNTIWPKIKTALADVWGFINTYIIGPDGVFTKVYNWLKTAIGEAIAIAEGVLAGLKKAWDDISTAVGNVIGWIDTVIEKLKNIKLPDWLQPGSPPPLALALFDIAKGFMMAAAAAEVFGTAVKKYSGAVWKTPGLAGAITGFAGAILSRFQAQYTTPLEAQVTAAQEEVDTLQAQIDAGNNSTQMLDLLAQKQKELADITEKYSTEKERELALQKQLNDLAYLQAQMDFISFLAENNLAVSDILGNLQLGLGLDLPSFMDAITRALAVLVANLNTQITTPGEIPGTPPASPFAGPGFAGGGGGGNAVYNTVSVNMNVALNNGMDTEQFRVFVLDTVSGALR